MAGVPDHRSGGKMPRLRRTRAGTPYDRPTASPQNSNWFSRFVSSPSRIISTGGKLLFSVLASDSSSSSSSSTSLPTSDDVDNDGLENVQGGSSLGAGLSEKALSQKSETKQLIARLLVHETFSREECEWLINIVKSRVVNIPSIGSVEAGRLDGMLCGRNGNDMNSHTLLNTTVMEARQWLEKKNGSNSNSDLQLGMGALNSAMLTNGGEDDCSSPVDIAKSYMQSRPPWASPSISHSEVRSPSARQYSASGSSFNLKYKKAASASSSWNILDEIRKVKSKATEELLKNPASSRICWPSSALDYKYGADLQIADKSATRENNMATSGKAVDASTDLITGEGSENILDKLQNDALQDAGPLSPGQKQIEEGIWSNEEAEGGCHQNYLVTEEVVGAVKSNGFCLPSSLSGAGEVDHIPLDKPCETVPLERGKQQNVPEEEPCPNSEASSDMVKVFENDITGLQDTSDRHHELEDLDHVNKKRKLDDKSVDDEKQAGRKMSKYNRRGRGKAR